MASTFAYAGSTLARGIRNFDKKTRDEILQRMGEVAEEMLEYAKRNAPWDDRTGDARSGLSVDVSGGFQAWGKNAAYIDLYHTVDYGIWLEVRWNGRYAIIIPTLEVFGPKVMSALDGMIGDIVYYA